MRLLTSYEQYEITFVVLFLILCSSASATVTATSNHHRRILHQPFFPRESTPSTLPPPSSSPQPQPAQQHQPKLPFSSSSYTPPKPFFPSYHSLPPPPSPTALATFPANISSLLFPQPSSPNHHAITAIAVSVSLFTAGLLAALFAFIFYRRHRQFTSENKAPRSDSIRLYPPDIATSDGSHKPRGTSSTSSEFLYLGNVVNSREAIDKTASNSSDVSATIPYQKLGSPELKPLPPLPRYNFRRNSNDENDEEEFYSPRGSSGRSPRAAELEGDKLASGSLNSRSRAPSRSNSNSASPTNSVSMNSSHTLNLSPTHSPDSIIDLPLPQQPSSLQQPPETNVPVKLPPPPPPPPPPRFWEIPSAERLQISDHTPKPKLKPLHWDKVRASSDRATVWDQLKASSFQLNEEMIESLFVVNNSSLSVGRRQMVRPSPTENRVLDPRKSQNIAILLRALNVTIDEVCEALREGDVQFTIYYYTILIVRLMLEGNCDTLGTELLESLLKMAPTEEEECKLKEFKDESPLKLGPAEKFLKVILDIPFAFKRIDAMLYIANFDSEVEYLNKSFETLEAACEELRNSRMFLKLLEAVLRTGNRMNVGTNRGGAQAFKLDTLVKLVDIKGTDGKTSLLHFVVQEIVRTEGSRISGAHHHQNAEKIPQPTLHDEVEFRKLGLQVVSGLSGELMNVKKAAAMDSDMLSSEVAKLARGITKVMEVVKLNEETPLKETSRKLSEAMKGFLRKGEEEISRIQAQEKGAFSLVKDITEYFHGNSAKEEAHPFRIFMVVRDFLSILDRVCKDVGKVNERTLVGSRQYPSLANNPILPAIFPEIVGRQQFGSSSSDDEIDSSL
ncbi:hypothetical protein L6164_023928 [Bauhinia variegata]|uniref:Uncharacterized protein n=1 Tax=Bauhinia variegata TaxID=167791 RepID=A0ACB9MM23_BAUVA|nr:hypothetical protein L6164_023928 [Bauhinia variegata]